MRDTKEAEAVSKALDVIEYEVRNGTPEARKAVRTLRKALVAVSVTDILLDKQKPSGGHTER